MSDWVGRYISLDESAARREPLEESLQALGLARTYSRFAALRGDGRPCKITQKELGCFLSHLGVLKEAPRDRFLHVIEDDAYLPARFKGNLAAILSHSQAPDWDVLFLNTMCAFEIAHLRDLLALKRRVAKMSRDQRRQVFVTVSGKSHYLYGTSSYVVNPASAGKIVEYLDEVCAVGPNLQIDNAYRRGMAAGRLHVALAFPFITGIRVDQGSTIDDRQATHRAKDVVAYDRLVNLFVDDGRQDERRLFAFDQLADGRFDVDAFIATQTIYAALRAGE